VCVCVCVPSSRESVVLEEWNVTQVQAGEKHDHGLGETPGQDHEGQENGLGTAGNGSHPRAQSMGLTCKGNPVRLISRSTKSRHLVLRDQ
jgi:hypothetical protein